MTTNANDNVLNYLIEFIRDLLKFWYIVVISMGLTLGLGMFYVKFAAKTYNVAASVVIKTEQAGTFGGISDNMNRVNDLIEQDKNLQNEIYLLSSTPLIRSVVDEMDIQVAYYLQEDKIPMEVEFSMKELYKGSPILVIPDNKHFQPVDIYFYVKILDDETYMVWADEKEVAILNFETDEVVVPSTSFHLSGSTNSGEVVTTPFTSFRMILNSNYNSEAYQGKDLFFQFRSRGALALQFKADLSVEASSIDATMVDMYVKSDNLQKGIDFLNRLVENYIENNLEKKNFLAEKTIEHLDFQLDDISKSLGSSEQELQDIRRSSSVMNIDEKAGNVYNQLQEAQVQRDDIERRRNYLLQMEDYFTSNRDSSGFMAPSGMGIDDPLLSSLINELTDMTSERQQLINNNQLRSPRLRTLNITIGNLTSVILENVQYSLNTTNAELRDINNRIGGLNREYSSLPYTQRQLLGIERKFNLSENVYMSLLEQRIQAQIIKASTLSDCELVEPPMYAGVAAPKTLLVLVGALILGLFFPTVFVLIRKLFTNRVANKEELRRYTSLNQVGSIPQHTRGAINVIKDQPNSIAAEAFHSLRSNIIYYLMGKSNQIILVTSTMEGEGKSFSALNLASSLAVTNNKTILVEFDLRRPSEIYNKLGIRGLVGVSSYLIRKASIDEITIASGVPNLDIMLAGQIPPNPIELISGEQTQILFDELRKKYDYIIVDTPPYGLLTDSFVLMRYSDLNIYVSRLGIVKKRMLLTTLDDIEAKDIKNLHLLINGDIPKKGAHGKYYTYHKKKGLFGLVGGESKRAGKKRN
ncbi:MAG: polysaccharide biosynthesis tyrosine autokinase [Bacteroidales bacterium]